MTNEEWIEELYMLSAQIGKFSLMHNKVDELKIKHPNLNIIECVELAYIELKRQYEEEIELNEQSILN
jgi:hypothetical protein